MNTLPWTHDVRADTGTTNVRLGMWLFSGPEAMFAVGRFGWRVMRGGPQVSHAGAAEQESAAATVPAGNAR